MINFFFHFLDSNECSYDSVTKSFNGCGKYFHFFIVTGRDITPDANPCYTLSLRHVSTSSPTKCIFKNGVEFDLSPVGPVDNKYEYEVINEKGNFSLLNPPCMLSLI